MKNDAHPTLNYWQLLAAAEQTLDGGDFVAAEKIYYDAIERRQHATMRVFFSERFLDGLARLTRRGDPQPGRWMRSVDKFRERFLADAERMVREGVRVAELRPEDDAERNQPVLEKALFLVARSRIFLEEPASAVPLLKGLFRTASRTGRPFDLHLVRHDIPLTEEDRLWMARKGGELLEAFVESGVLEQGSAASQEWAQAFLQLLQQRYFGSGVRLEEERCWLEAITADRLLGRAIAAVELYRVFLSVNPGPSPRSDEARVRLIELFGNTDRVHFPVPRYDEALGAMQSGGPASGSALVARFERALGRIEYRRPEAGPLAEHNLAWASVAVEADGRLAVVFWWGDEPRDVAFWQPGESAVPLDSFLALCGDRVVAADDGVVQAVAGVWGRGPSPWSAAAVLTAVMESRLPAAGPERDALVRIGLGETQPWRAGWDPGVGHPLLEPPRRSSLVESWPQGPASGALLGGLIWLAVRSRLHAGDPALRAGVGAMARRGDPVCRFLYPFVCLNDEGGRALDATFEPWTLPILWTRPDPFGWSASSPRATAGESEADVPASAPNLGRSDLAIVSTGNPSASLAAWGDGRQKWRVVLDRSERLEALGRVAGGVVGPITLIPRDGTVHDLDAALRMLDDLLSRPAGTQEPLLPLLHWMRLVETHNGDLLDFCEVRPRPDGAVPLYDHYARLVARLPRENPRLGGDGSRWAEQYSQRVRKAGLVAGTGRHLSADSKLLDALWGVFEGSDASWVFLDSAAVHWELLRRKDLQIRALHGLLHTRGRRHLSLLTGAIWLRPELEELLGSWLGVFGNPYRVALGDARPPRLRLADRGAVPDARWLLPEAMAAQATWIERVATAEGRVTVMVPGEGSAASFWSEVRDGRASGAGPRWRFMADESSTAGQGGCLVLPALVSLQGGSIPVAVADDRESWLDSDAERRTWLAWRTKLCALEVAARLAGPWACVDVLDTRWWRLLRSRRLAGADAPGAGRWGGERAAAASTDGLYETFDLPGFAAGDAGTSWGRFLPAARDWAAAQRILPGPIDASGGTGAEPQAGVQLLVGDLDPVWASLARRTAAAWERGDLDHWVLLVSDACPAGAAELVAGGFVDGVSVWGGEGPPYFPAPIMRVAPGDFSDPELRSFLAAHPPRTVVATGLYEWLPAHDREAQESAFALRALLDARAHQVILQTVQMPAPWIRFVERACGAQVLIATGGESAHPDRMPSAALLSAPGDPYVGAADRPAAVIRRFQGLLARLRPVMAARPGYGSVSDAGKAPPPGRQLLPLDWLACLGGLSADDVERGAGLLRWVARLAGDPLSAASVPGAGGRVSVEGHALVLPFRYAEIENQIGQLMAGLSSVLPHWLADVPPGTLTWIDMEHPPAGVASDELMRIDTFLAMVGAGALGHVGLTYSCPRGLLYSTRRLVGATRPVDALLDALENELGLFSARICEVMTTATPTPEGLMVHTGVTDLGADERNFLALGAAIGLWRWLGPACSGAVPLVDLLSLADSPTVREGDDGWNLLGALVHDRFVAEVDADDDAHSERVQGHMRRALRGLLPGGSDGDETLSAVVAQVADVAGVGEDRRFLVLRGTLGSGRHEALVRGLVQARREAADPGEITIYCPDAPTATFVSRECVRHGLNGPLDIRVPAPGATIDLGRPGGAEAADPSAAVIVMCEVQRFEPETRYRIAQLGRGRRLVMTVDQAAATEPWEHLFLTTPRADDVVTLPVQRRLARRPWAEVGHLAPLDRDPGHSRRRDKGMVLAEYAANLDQCVARITAAQETGELGPSVRVIAPLPPDVEYIGASLQARGWRVVSESNLDWLMLPGPREMLGAVVDELSAGWALSNSRGRREAVAAAGDAAPHDSTPASAPLLPRFGDPSTAAACRQWQEQRMYDPLQDLAGFAAEAAASNWGQSVFAHAETRSRLDEVLAAWGREPLAALYELPLWQAWIQLTCDDLGDPAPAGGPPLAIVTEAARTGGAFVPSGVYMCQGTEDARRHYEILGRLTDQALVLYQVRSPLPGDAG